MRLLLGLTLLLGLFTADSHGFDEGTAVVVVRAESVVEAGQVYLRDVAEIRAKDETKEMLSRLSLGLSPKIGSVRMISPRKVRLVIAAAGFSLRKVRIRMTEHVYVTRRGMSLSKEDLEESLRESILAEFGDRIELLITRLEVPEPGNAPIGKVEFRPKFKVIRNPFERFSLPVDVIVNKKLVKKLSAQVELEAFATVGFLNKELAANARITPADVGFEKRRIDRPLSKFLTNTSEVKGIKTTQLMRTGEVLTKNTFVKAIVIRNGDNVRIEAVSKSFKIAATGTALSPGRIGDQIAVKNGESGKVFKALIIEKGLVRVRF